MLKKFNSKKGKEIHIRYLCEDDTKDLLKLYNSLVDEKALTIATEKLKLKQEREFVNDSLSEIEKGNTIFLVAEYDKTVIGNVSIKKQGLLEEHVGDLGIIILNGFRGEGLGRELMNECIKEAKRFLKIKIVTLSVFKENKSAILLYEKMGFSKFGEIKKGFKHFGRYKDELFMVKYLF